MEKTKALVLYSQRFSDSQLIVHLYTEVAGAVSVLVRIPAGRRNSQRLALWQVLGLVDVELDIRQGRDLHYVKDAMICRPWTTLCYDPVKSLVAIFLGEFLHHALKGEGRNDALFLFLEKSLIWFDEADSRFANFHLVLMMRLMRFMGFWPNVEGEHTKPIFDMVNGCYCETLPEHGKYLVGEDVRIMPLMLKMNYMQMHRVHLTRNERWHMLETILLYYRLHVPAFGELKSLEVLREVFD